MNIPYFTLIAASIAFIYAVFYFLDAKYGYRFIDWCNSACNNPLVKKRNLDDGISESDKYSRQKSSANAPASKAENYEEISVLQERIAVLEKIVTQPAYELNKKINQL